MVSGRMNYTRSQKKYPMNGPSLAEQADVVYHWRGRQAAVKAYRKMLAARK